MIGYFPQRQDGELLYSTTARAAAMMYPGKKVRYIAGRMLGNSNLSFGGPFPNHAKLLMTRIPEITGLTKESVIDGSAYHLIAPFLSDTERQSLLATIFDVQPNGARRWFTRCHQNLCYCVLCARQDESAGRARIWRVLHNHPAVNCCPEHKCRLTNSRAYFDFRVLHDPAVWIDPDSEIPPPATKEEVGVAADFQWLYDQKSNIRPGFRAVVSVLRDLLLQNRDFRRGPGQLESNEIRRSLLSTMPTAIKALDPRIFSPGWETASLLRTDIRLPVQRYSLFAQLAGWTLKDVFEKAACMSKDLVTAEIRPLTRTPEVIRYFKDELVSAVKSNPRANRTKLYSICPQAMEVVRRADRLFYEEAVPKRGAMGIKRGGQWYANWDAFDTHVHTKISTTPALLKEVTPGFAGILQKLRLSRWTIRNAKGRLPKTKALLLSLKAHS